MSELQWAENAVDWFVQTFGTSIQKLDERAGKSLLDFWENPSPQSKARLVADATAAIKANAAAMAPSQPAAAPGDPQPSEPQPEAGAHGGSIYTGEGATR